MRTALALASVALLTACHDGLWADLFDSLHPNLSDTGTVDTGTSVDDTGEGYVEPIGDPVVYFPFNVCGETTPEVLGSGLEAKLGAASCGGGDSLSDTLGGSWSSGTALVCSGAPHPVCATAPDHPLFEPREFTIAAWVASPDWWGCDGQHCTIVSKGNTDGYPVGYWLAVVDGTPRLNVQGHGGETSVWASQELEPNTWHHLTATYDGHTATLYVDGERSAAGPIGHGLEYGSERLEIGAIPNRHYTHNGPIDELTLWNAAMTRLEVAELYVSYLSAQ